MVDSMGKLITSEPPEPRTVPPELMGELLDTWEYVNRHELYIDLHHRMLGTVERFICAHVGESRGWGRAGVLADLWGALDHAVVMAIRLQG
jgi:hypothetical protein